MPQVFEEVEMASDTWISSKEALRWAKAQDATARASLKPAFLAY